MPLLRDLAFRVKALFGSQAMERELDDELAFHLDMETEKLIAEGLDPRAARQEATRRFGGAVRQRERVREAWGIGVLRDLQADVRHALRQFRRQPGFTAVAVLTLALGIGATVALYSVVNGLMLRPLPVAHEDRVRVLWSDYNWRGAEFDHVADRAPVFEEMASFSTDAALLRTDAGTTLLETVVGSAELFEVLGTRPLLGRTFAPGEDRPGAEPVAVLSFGVWQQELGGDPDIIGRRIVLGGISTTVIGVMPRAFYFPTPTFRLWRPLNLDPADGNYQNNGWLTLVGRLTPDADATGEQRGVDEIVAALDERFTYPEAWDKRVGAYTVPLREYLFGNLEPAVLLLLGAVATLLLMACTNTAALVIARTTDRTQEMAVRAALGAGRGRVARQVLTESMTLALIAGAAGALVAITLFKALVSRLPLQEFGDVLTLDWTTFAVALVLALLVGAAVSILPLRTLGRGGLHLSGTRSETGRARAGRTQATLVTVEVTLAVLLVVGATLLIRSVERITALDPGFDPNGVVVMDLVVSPDEMPEEERRQFFREVLTRIEASPGVVSAGYTNRLPVRQGGWQGLVSVEGRDDLVGPKRPNSLYRWATPDFFRTMGITLKRGRAFTAADTKGAPQVVMVSESFAKRMWPGEDPLGKGIASFFTGTDRTDWWRVVGVFEETRMVGMTGENPMVYYLPYEQTLSPGEGQVLVIKAAGAPAPVIAGVRAIVQQVDPRAALTRVNTMRSVVSNALAEPLRLRFFLSLLAGLALVIGMVGVYGVVSYTVVRRRPEFGIRMAMGAAPGRVVKEVLAGGVRPVGAGIALGILGTLGFSTIVAGFLYGVTPTDLASLLVAALVMLAVGLVAGMVPAWRAGRVNPVEVLRSE